MEKFCEKCRRRGTLTGVIIGSIQDDKGRRGVFVDRKGGLSEVVGPVPDLSEQTCAGPTRKLSLLPFPWFRKQCPVLDPLTVPHAEPLDILRRPGALEEFDKLRNPQPVTPAPVEEVEMPPAQEATPLAS